MRLGLQHVCNIVAVNIRFSAALPLSHAGRWCAMADQSFFLSKAIEVD